MIMNESVGNEILKEIRETNKWLRVIATPELRQRLSNEISTPEEYRVYQASQGGSTREVAAQAKVGVATVHAMWARWSAAGILEETTTSGRYVRLVDLKTLGIEAPETKKKRRRRGQG